MKYNKLVRDRIPEIIEKNGAKAVTRILTDEEYKVFLEKKLDEEVAEFHKSKNIEELADVLEVLHALKIALGFNDCQVIDVRLAKLKERGGFWKKILLIETIDKAEEEQKNV